MGSYPQENVIQLQTFSELDSHETETGTDRPEKLGSAPIIFSFNLDPDLQLWLLCSE